MTIRHHPSDATLLAYAAGSLGEGLSLVVASHLSFCAACRAAVAEGEAMGGGLLEALEPERVTHDARARLLARLDHEAIDVAPPPVRPRDPLIPAALGRYVARPLADLPWRRLGPGVRQLELMPRDRRGANLRLLRVGAGGLLPRHGHRGTELTLVLTGSFSDELGRFARGDVGEVDSEITHQPVIDAGEECICLIATEGLLRFDGLLGRVLQRFTGF